jgi:hypothetical protein
MPPEIRIAHERGIIRAVYKGKPEPASTSGMLRDVGALAARTQCDRVLFDLRDADLADMYINAVRYADEAESLGVRRTFRIALLGRPDPVLSYLENVAVNRGYTLRTFTDEQAAEAWLNS